jgi:hypothetical protein
MTISYLRLKIETRCQSGFQLFVCTAKTLCDFGFD